MDGSPKEFPQTGADGSGQVSPQLGSFWLPNQSGDLPDGMTPDFSVPRYEEGVSDIYIPDYHPPEMIPDHPFKVDRFFDYKKERHRIRVRVGRFYLLTAKDGPGTKAEAMGSVTSALDGNGQEFFGINGDGGPPSFGNVAPTAGGVASCTPKEFTDNNKSPNVDDYAFFDVPDTDKETHVALRYVIDFPTMKLHSQGDNLNIVVKAKPDSGETFVNKSISALQRVNFGTEENPEYQLVRANRTGDQLVTGSEDGLGFTVDDDTRHQKGIYYILLATVAKTGVGTGLVVNQYIHENITFGFSSVEHTQLQEDYGVD